MKELLVKKMNKNAIIPTRGSEQSAGADLYACIDQEVVIKAGGRAIVSTGIAIALEEPNSVGYVFARSGLGINHGIALSNGVGVIDSDYRGEIKVGLINNSFEDYIIKPNDRIAQLVIMPVYLPMLIESQQLPDSDRGDQGFGSTGK